MPPLLTVTASNEKYAPSYIPTAVFIGGTSGIGQAMAELFATQTKGRANIILIGRNKAAAEKIIAGFPSPPASDEEGAVIKHEFVQCDASELKNVHETTQELLKRLEKINILVLCAAILDFKPIETAEGLDRSMVLRYYSRAKFTHELMPLLTNAKAKGEDARVVTILGAAMGGRVDLTDLGTKTWSLRRMAHHTGTYNDILVKVQSERHPDMAFVHIHPGAVDTPGLNSLWVVRLLHPILRFFLTSPADCAQWMMYPLLSSEFSNGGYWLDRRAGTKELGDNVSDDIAKTVWEHTVEVAQLQ